MNNVQTYQTAQFVSNSQQTSQTMTNCSYSQPQQYAQPGIYQLDGSGKHTITMSSANSSTIVKLTNSTDILSHQQMQQQQQQIVQTNHQFIQTSQPNSDSVGYSSGGQQIVGQPMVSQAIVGQPITIANSAPFSKAPGQLTNANSSTYTFQKLSSLTKDSPNVSSNLIVQNATIVNSTVVNTSSAPLQSPVAFSPSSQAPISQAPISQAPISQVPISQAPISQASISQVPISQAPVLPKSSDSFSNLPSPFQEPVTYIDPFTGEVEVEKKRANAGPPASSPAHQPVNSNAKNSNVNNASYPDGAKEAGNHLSDSDSGISKSTNDSQSSTERISPSDLIHQTIDIGQAKLNAEPATLLGDQSTGSSLVHFNSDSMIGEPAILKTHNNLNDMLAGPESLMNHEGAKYTRKPELNSINQQVYMLNDSLDKNKSAIHTGAGDQIDDYFNTTDLSDFHLGDSSARLLEDEHFAGLPNSQSGALNVNDFLTADFGSESATNKLEFDEQELAGGHSIAGDHNYTSSGDHTYTTNTLKRPCASFNAGGNSTNSNICSNKIKKVNS